MVGRNVGFAFPSCSDDHDRPHTGSARGVMRKPQIAFIGERHDHVGATSVAAGEFSLPSTGRGAAQQNNAFKQLPAFCRVAVTLKPSNDSDIKIIVWMPSGNWNNKIPGRWKWRMGGIDQLHGNG